MRFVKLAIVLLLGSCGGGGGGAAATVFDLAGVTPRDGTVDASIDAEFAITFTAPLDLGSATPDSVRLETGSGALVSGTLIVQPSSPTNLRFDPFEALLYNSAYRLVIRGTLRSFEGTPLGADRVVRFITESPGPTVRPDQLVDLGDALRVPRFLAQAHATPSGRIVVFGGYRSPGEVAGTAEVFDPATRTFRLVASPMDSPRAEFTATALPDGRVLLAGGVAAPGGEPLASTEVFDPVAETFVPGPPMLVGRRRHAACAFPGSGELLVTGGIGADGQARTDGERLRNGAWTFAAGALETGTADHAQVPIDADTIYVSVGNAFGKAALFDQEQLRPRQEFDGRLRTTLFKVDGDRVFVIGGDTRSIGTFDLDSGTMFPANVFLAERRGAHTATRRGDAHRFLVAGGFNIARVGGPALDSMEVVEYVPVGLFAFPDANVYPVPNLRLPRPFAGHVAGTAADGAILLAGGFGDGVGEHSRRAVLVLP